MVKEDEGVDLEGLTVEPAELLPVPRGKAPKPNPMTEHLERSWDEEQSLSVKVTAAEALPVGRSLRKAAMRMGIGVTVQYHILPGEVYCPESKVRDLAEGTQVRVVFQAREKTEATRRESDDEN